MKTKTSNKTTKSTTIHQQHRGACIQMYYITYTQGIGLDLSVSVIWMYLYKQNVNYQSSYRKLVNKIQKLDGTLYNTMYIMYPVRVEREHRLARKHV